MHPFSLLRPSTLRSARVRIAEQPNERMIRAGGIDLIDRMKEGLDRPLELIELATIRDAQGQQMRYIGPIDDNLGPRFQIGSRITLAELAGYHPLPSAYSALRQAAGSAATPGIRNSATVGGNLLQRPRCWYYRNSNLPCLKKGGGTCLSLTGDNRYNAILGGGPTYVVHPSSLATPLLALNAYALVYTGEGPLKKIPFSELFVAPTEDPTREHSLVDGEILIAIDIPLAKPNQHSAYAALREKQSHDWPLVEASASLQLESGLMKNLRLSLGHVAPIPWPARLAEKQLEGQRPDATLFKRALETELEQAQPLSHNGYKIQVAIGLGREVLHRATNLPLPE